MTNQARPQHIANTVILVLVVLVNYLANALPLAGRTTGELSDLYPSLITPTGFTFSIWSIIYLGLLLFVAFQFRSKAPTTADAAQKIGWWFVGNGLANMAWIFAWHYQLIGLSVLIMLLILATLIMIHSSLYRADLTSKAERWLVRPVFTIYLGWITVATITNVSVFLISSGWEAAGPVAVYWTIGMLLISALLGVAFTVRERTPVFAWVLTWAYFGIWFKRAHTTPEYSTLETLALILTIGMFVVSLYPLVFRKNTE